MGIKEEIEEYRKNNQMDYLFAIDLLHKYPRIPKIFESIYKITRVHVPDTVFKYYSLSDDHALNKMKMDTILDKKVYMATPDELNDPFEANAYFVKSDHFDFKDIFQDTMFDVFNTIKDKILVTSFTSQGTNCMPMWAHYTNNHRGFCVSYDTNENSNFQLRSNLMRVQYVDNRVDVTHILKDFSRELKTSYEYDTKINEKEIKIDNLILVHVIIFLACLKHKSWSYEHELRCITSVQAPWVPFMEAIPSEIYIGNKCSDDNVGKLKIMAAVLDIPIYKMKFENESISYEYKPYELIIE